MNQAHTNPAPAGLSPQAAGTPPVSAETESLLALVLQSLDDDQATDVVTIPTKLDASAWPGVPAVFAGLVGALPKELV